MGGAAYARLPSLCPTRHTATDDQHQPRTAVRTKQTCSHPRLGSNRGSNQADMPTSSPIPPSEEIMQCPQWAQATTLCFRATADTQPAQEADREPVPRSGLPLRAEPRCPDDGSARWRDSSARESRCSTRRASSSGSVTLNGPRVLASPSAQAVRASTPYAARSPRTAEQRTIR